MLKDITCEDIFVSLAMGGSDTRLAEQILKDNPNESILAGGCIANTILNVESGTLKYRVNDLDVFILDKNPKNKPALESFQSKVGRKEEYMQIASPKLFMTGREETGEVDKVYMSIDQRYSPEDINFPQYVLNSFDLNCVSVGIYHDGTDFKLLVNPEFEKFLETRKVEVVNVHSEVTFLRAIKKAHDLHSEINLREEFDMIWYGCNSRYLNELTTEQLNKHKSTLESLGGFKLAQVKEYFAILKHSQPLHDEVYKSFFGTRLMGNRRDKIKLIRYFREPDRKQFLCSPHVFDYENTLYVASRYDGELSEFFGTTDSKKVNRFSDTMVRSLNSFIADTGISWVFHGKTLQESCDIMKELEEIYFDKTQKTKDIEDGKKFYKLVRRLPFFMRKEELELLEIKDFPSVKLDLEAIPNGFQVVVDELDIPF